jgi:uncharacterized protein
MSYRYWTLLAYWILIFVDSETIEMVGEIEDDLVLRARRAVEQYPHSDVEVGAAFLRPHLRAATLDSSWNDRLCQTGRRVAHLVHLYPSTAGDEEDQVKLQRGLQLLVQEFTLVTHELPSQGGFQVPRVRFGKTDLEISIVTLGCMRFQQEWGPRITQMNQVYSNCQGNLYQILYQACVVYGMNHIETARGYGCSELQLGVALQLLYQTTSIQRSDLLIQTKIPPHPDVVTFREMIDTSMRNLQVDYLDLFALHGFNFEEQYDWVFGKDGNNCLAIVKEYVAAGKIRHVGFSTHGSTQFILKCIHTNVFDYVNLHYHYFGSYTASGNGSDGNLDVIRLLNEKDMGRFIISPFDKGGRLYAPSKKLASLMLPDMDPMTFQSLWLWNHHRIYDPPLPQIHTYTIGVARPSDLDQPIRAAYWHATQLDMVLNQVKSVTLRLDHAKEVALGKEWVQTWWQGLPKNTESKYLVEHNQIVWIYNCIVAFGMYEFGKTRYNSFEKNNMKWDETKSDAENIDVIGKNAWGYVPGRPLKMGVDYSEDLIHVPEQNKQRVLEAEEFVYHWCRDKSLDPKDEDGGTSKTKKGGFLRHFSRKASKKTSNDSPVQNGVSMDEESDETIPEDWETAYDLRTWPDFPDQSMPAIPPS